MAVSMMGTMGAYTRNMRLRMQWTLKQRSGDITGHKKSLDEWLQASRTFARDPGGTDEASQDYLRSIHTKLDAGKKLTSEERAYLKAKDPQTYAKLEAIEQERRAYEQKLKQCRTREEVQRLKMAYMNSSLMVVRAVENNSAIPKNKKLEVMTQEKRRCGMLEESTQAFIRRGEYARLPTDQERAKAEREEAEKRLPEETARETAKPADTLPQPTQEASPEEERPSEAERPGLRAESPEARKTRRAKARAAYAASSSFADAPALDIQA